MHMHHIPFTSGTRKISGQYFPVAEIAPTYAVLHIHGWQSGQDRNYSFAEQLVLAGIPSLTFDLSAHGESEGTLDTLSRKDFFDDVLAGYDALTSLVPPNTKIIVHGSSFGGYQAALLSQKRRVHALILRVPADYPREGFTDVHVTRDAEKDSAWRAQRRGTESSDALLALSVFDGAVLLVEASADTIVDHQCVQNYADVVKNSESLTYITMMGAPHSFTHAPKHKKDFIALSLGWIRSLS